MDDPSVPRETKMRDMRAAVDFQTQSRLDCTTGQGCDRHMMGLLLAARELGRDIPQVFADKVKCCLCVQSFFFIMAFCLNCCSIENLGKCLVQLWQRSKRQYSD